MRTPKPEFLLIDAGNTQLKWATAGRKRSIHVAGAIATAEATPQWIIRFVRKFPEQPIVLASVVPRITRSFFSVCRKRLHVVSGAGRISPPEFDYPEPAEIGADRIAAAVAAHALKKYPTIIVACGTATAFTVLDAKGRLCGGAIAPGLRTQLAALIGATAQLPATTLQPPRSALAKSTQGAIRAGVMLNFQGGAKEILHQLTWALPGRKRPHIILTGGNAHYLAKNLDVPFALRPLLIFEGLLIIGLRVFTPAE